jgi:hypothetical protein
LFTSAEMASAVYRIQENGDGLKKVIAVPLLVLAVSPDGRWVAVEDPSAWGSLTVHPIGGGPSQRLCDLCAPPWGVQPIPFYFGWSADGRFLHWSFDDTTFAIPLRPGQVLPPIPAGGIQSLEGVAKLPGARVMSTHAQTFPGPDLDTFVFMKEAAQRNIYRVPVR